MFWNLVNPGYGPIALNEGVGSGAIGTAALRQRDSAIIRDRAGNTIQVRS